MKKFDWWDKIPSEAQTLINMALCETDARRRLHEILRSDLKSLRYHNGSVDQVIDDLVTAEDRVDEATRAFRLLERTVPS